MEYIYEKVPRNYEDFASGRVLYNAQGTTSFPVRLASEIYLRGRSYLKKKSEKENYTLYDPCCGGAYLLTTIGLLHGKDLKRVIGSDIEYKVIELATRNISLINSDGLNERIEQITKMLKDFGKESHKDALDSALRLKHMVDHRNTSIMFDCFQADATKEEDKRNQYCKEVDFVITDVPYGNVVKWTADRINPIESLLGNIFDILNPISVVVVIADKKQVIEHAKYRRLERIKVGKRQVVFLEPQLS